MKDNLDAKFENDGLEKQIKKVKRKSFFKNLLISLIVTIAVIAAAVTLNTRLNLKEMEKDLERVEGNVALTIPNGYILEASYDFGILGGKARYKIARQLGAKSVILEDYISPYGSLNIISSATYGNGIRFDSDIDEAHPEFWENGYRKMIFYHPDIDYKDYKNDLDLLEEIPEGKIIEMGISLDKGYSISEINDIFVNIKPSWIGLDMFRDKLMEDEKDESENNNPSLTYISESNIIGISMYNISSESIIESKITELVDLLKVSLLKEDNELYEKYYNEDNEYTTNIIAVTIHGTKDELMKLKDNKHVKASSIGVVEDLY